MTDAVLTKVLRGARIAADLTTGEAARLAAPPSVSTTRWNLVENGRVAPSITWMLSAARGLKSGGFPVDDLASLWSLMVGAAGVQWADHLEYGVVTASRPLVSIEGVFSLADQMAKIVTAALTAPSPAPDGPTVRALAQDLLLAEWQAAGFRQFLVLSTPPWTAEQRGALYEALFAVAASILWAGDEVVVQLQAAELAQTRGLLQSSAGLQDAAKSILYCWRSRAREPVGSLLGGDWASVAKLWSRATGIQRAAIVAHMRHLVEE